MKIAKSIKNCSFNCKVENTKKYIFFLLKKKKKDMNVSLDALPNNSSEKTYNKKYSI